MVFSGHCVTVLGLTPGCSGNHWVSGSLEGDMHVPLHMLVIFLCSAHMIISCRLPFLDFLPSLPFFDSLTHYRLNGFSTILPVPRDRG